MWQTSHAVFRGDIDNMFNEACIIARGARPTFDNLYSAFERVTVGDPRKSMELSPEELQQLAAHEAGHYVVARALKLPVRPRISIIPRMHGVGGYVLVRPRKDYIMNYEDVFDHIVVLLAGQQAERFVCGTASTGAKDDVQKARDLAQKELVQSGTAPGSNLLVSEEAQDELAQDILRKANNTAQDVITQNGGILHAIHAALLEKRVLSRDDLAQYSVVCA